MSITLDGIVLNPNLNWSNRFKESSVVQSNTRLLAGNLVTLQASVVKGMSIVLVATESQGWFTKTQLDSIISIANTIGNTFVLNYDGESYTVVFDHASGSAYEFTPLIHRPVYDSTDYFTGTLKLLTA